LQGQAMVVAIIVLVLVLAIPAIGHGPCEPHCHDSPDAESCIACCRQYKHEQPWNCEVLLNIEPSNLPVASCCKLWDRSCWDVPSELNNMHACNQCVATALQKFTNPLNPVAGTSVTWTYVVTAVAPGPVQVTDSPPETIHCPFAMLSLNDVMTCTAVGVAVEGPFSNTATAMIGGNSFTATSSYVGLPNPCLSLPNGGCDLRTSCIFDPTYRYHRSGKPYFCTPCPDQGNGLAFCHNYHHSCHSDEDCYPRPQTHCSFPEGERAHDEREHAREGQGEAGREGRCELSRFIP